MALLTKVTLPNGALFNQSQAFLGADSLFTTGTVLFVNSVTGSNDNSGTDPSTPKATVQGAISAATASKGDKIVCMVGHAETVTATSINLSKAGVTVICLGHGLERPTFTYGAAAATITVSAANCAFLGGHHIGNFDNILSAFTLGASKNFSLIGNTFVDNTAALHFMSIVITNATDNDSDGLTIVDNKWYGLALAPDAAISILAAELHLTVTDNFVDMGATNDVGHFITFAAKITKGTQILRNILIVTGATGATVGVFMTGSGTTHTGVVADNYAASLDATTELFSTAALTFYLFNNRYTGAVTGQGYLLPAIDA